MTKKGYKQTPEHIAARKRFGADHPKWLGESVSDKGGRARALRMYPEIGPCIKCGSPRSERHHKDGRTSNNEPDNIEIVCRKCHMSRDGRSAALSESFVARQSHLRDLAATKKRSMTNCKRGHSLSDENVYVYNGKRSCRACRKALRQMEKDVK